MTEERKNLIQGIILGTVIGLILEIGGYLLLRGDQSEFGYAMFVAVPILSGFAVAAVVRRPKRVLACGITSGLITFWVLLFTGWEGIVCCVMSLPLVALGFAIGGALGYRFIGKKKDERAASAGTAVLLLFICPLLMAAADRVERPYRSVQQREVFTTETVVNASPDRTWDLVAKMERLDGDRPFLLRVGLPIPTRCELDRAEVGGRRVCYFHNGLIAQEVTGWDRPAVMKLLVTESTLAGRHWLTFIDASYELSGEGTQTRIVRHTTIGTRLYPRWYWRPLERWGVVSEHDFVFANLRRWTQTP